MTKIYEKNIVLGADVRESFKQLSYDSNPMHIDPIYSRRTQFGRPVMFGIAGLLYGLGSWAEGRKFQLLSLKVDFKKPLFEDQTYSLRIEENEHHVRMKISMGGVARTIASWHWQALPNEAPFGSTTDWKPLTDAVHVKNIAETADLLRQQPLAYQYNRSYEHKLKSFELVSGQMNEDQLNLLLGASYIIGMLIPGRQALFDGLSIDFKVDHFANGPTFNFKAFDYDERFGRMQISGDGYAVEKFNLKAFVRPEPIQSPISEIESVVGRTNRLKDKVVLVTGAGRGFGATLAQTLALQGARVIVHYHNGGADAESVCSAITGIGEKAIVIKGDLTLESDCDRVASEISNHFGNLDILVNSASPPIFSAGFLELNGKYFFDFAEKSIRVVVNPTRKLLPLMGEGALIINVSSQNTQVAQPGFSHYVLAKGAIEAWARALSWEFPHVAFITARPPRMKTDLTNLAFDPHGAESTISIAANLLKHIIKQPTGYQDINLY